MAVDSVNLFNLAGQQARWLAVRQNTVAGNIANANTPGYQAMDVEPFEKVLDRTGVTLARTEAGHLGGRAGESGFAVGSDAKAATVMPSGNDVTLEGELMKAGEIRRSFELNTAIVKAFHRMIMLSSKA